MNNEESDWEFDFDLSDRIAFFDKVVDRPNLLFKTSEKNITGFILTIKNSSLEEAERRRDKIAIILKYILTIKSGMPIDVNLKGYHSIPRADKSSHVTTLFKNSYRILGGFKTLDLTSSEIQSIMNCSESQSLKYQYLTKAIFHYYNKNPVDSIKEIFRLVSENTTFPDYEKLKALRDIFSHKPPYWKETRDLFSKHFKEDSFDYKKFDPDNCWIIINLESSKNQKLLNKLASDSIEIVRKDLKLPRS
jgi:hypothetical protein